MIGVKSGKIAFPMPKNTPINFLHHQYALQSQWTKNIRQYLLALGKANPESRILEVGCGTGAILNELLNEKYHLVTGIDISFEALVFAKSYLSRPHLSLANGLHLPFSNGCFDITLSHFFLLWIQNQKQALLEMKRVTKSGGAIIAFAEPDYPSRIDYPDELSALGKLQNLSLERQGVDIRTGRKLPELFSETGLYNIRFGILGSSCTYDNQENDFNFEWNYLKEDLSRILSESQIHEWMKKDWTARQERRRILYIPTFWAIGWV